MSEIVFNVLTQSGDDYDVEAPSEIQADEVFEEIAKALELPQKDVKGYPLCWRLQNLDTGRWLEMNTTLMAQGIEDGHRLALTRQILAGCFAPMTRVFLPNGERSKIEDIHSGDEILSFHAERQHYQVAEVQGIYPQPHPQSVRINRQLTISANQHLLLSDRTWKRATDLAEGDVLLAFPYGGIEVSTIEAEDGLTSALSLSLEDSLCIFAEGMVAKSALGNQTLLPRVFDVFLSYSAGDKDEARIIFDELETNGLTAFLSEKSLSPGDPWEERVLDALSSCKFFVILVAPSSLKSEWVTTEWAAAWALRKTIIPVLFRCRPADLPERVRRYHCIDFHELSKLIAAIRRGPVSAL